MDASTPFLALAHLTSGAIAAGMTTVTTQPLDNAVVRSQLSRILRKEGHPISLSGRASDDSIAGLLAREGGLTLPSVSRMLRETAVAKRGIEAGVFFATYALLKGARTDVYGGGCANIPAFEELGLGLLSGAVGRGVGVACSNLVFSRGSSRRSGGRGGGGGRGPKVSKKSLHKLRVKDVLAALKGVDGAVNRVFRGYFSAGFAKGVVEPGITIAIEQLLARALLTATGGREQGLVDIFILAVVGKMIATLATYPLKTAGARMLVAGGADIFPGGRNGETRNGSGSGNGNGNGNISRNAKKPGTGYGMNAPVEDENLIDLCDNERVSLEERPFADHHPHPHPYPQQQQPQSPQRPQMEKKPKYGSVFEAMRHVYRTEGLIALYDGVGGEMLRAVVHHTILMVGKELIHRFILRAALTAIALWKSKMVTLAATPGGGVDGKTTGVMPRPVPTVPKVPAPNMRTVNLLDRASRINHPMDTTSTAASTAATTASSTAAAATTAQQSTSPPPLPAGMSRMRSLHTGQYLPVPGERPWNIQQQAPTIRFARPSGEMDMDKLMKEKPWNLQQGVASSSVASGSSISPIPIDSLLDGPKSPAPSWVEMLPNIPWRQKPGVAAEVGSLATNVLGEGGQQRG